MIKIITFLMVAVFLNAQAARWVAEGAMLNLDPTQGVQVIKTIYIGDKVFTILETPDFVATSEAQGRLLEMTQARNVAQDIQIFLETPVENSKLPEASAGWHMDRMGYDRLNPQAQGQGVTVGVMDTGVDINHPALASQIWVNPNEIPSNNIDDDSNGYIDDTHGWNFVDNSNRPLDDHGHGTHCAGIIAALPKPDGTARGVAPAAKVMPLKIIGGPNATFLSDAAEAIVYGSNNGAKILSNSWGLYASWNGYNLNPLTLQIFTEAMNYAYYRGTVYVASAGNDSLNLDISNSKNLRIPLGMNGLRNILGIASADHDGSQDTASYFTNYGVGYVHFAAPGSNIMSTVPGGNWKLMSGTSMATPLFAGVMARMLSRGYTWIEATRVLAQTTDPEAQKVWNGKIKYGLIHPESALY